MSSAASAPEVNAPSSFKRKSDDIGWKYGYLADPNNPSKVTCKRCKKEVNGGIYRLKQHVAGIGNTCGKCFHATDEEKAECAQAIQSAQDKKKAKRAHNDDVRKEVNIDGNGDGSVASPLVVDDGSVEVVGSSSRPNTLGPMDKFANPIDPPKDATTTQAKRQQSITAALFKERLWKAKQYLARWMYQSNIAFNAIQNDAFKRFCEAIGRFGPGFEIPPQYELGGKLLKEEVERTKELLRAHEEERVLTGCSVMTDAWSDRKRRSIMNLCSHCQLGTSFLESREASDEPHTAELIFNYVDGCIERMGEENVVQVVTDNASNNMAAKEMLKEKRPRIFWSACATHTINLMLQSIGTDPKFKQTIDKAKAATIFIYSHHRTLALMRKWTKKRDIIRPGITRFASAYLTLQSMHKKRNELRNMTWSSEWTNNNLTKAGKGKAAGTTLGSRAFWNGVSRCLKVFGPLVHLLRMVDSDRASMAFVYGQILSAKKVIKEVVYDNKESEYKPIIEAMDKKMKNRLDGPLQLAAYLLNPFYSYADRGIFLDETIMDGFFTAVETFYHCDGDKQSQVINVDFEKFKKQEGFFGKFAARHGCRDMNFSPAGWWATYGCHTPTLQRMAIRILSLTASASGCERNWSTFEGIHTKKRNRLDVNRLENLVYVQFNARLMEKQEKNKEKNNQIDVLVANDAIHVQDWLIEEAYGPEYPVNVDNDDIIDVETGLAWSMEDEVTEPNRPRRTRTVRELYEDDFKSDSEGDVDVNDEEIEYEDDENEVGVDPMDDLDEDAA
ncbi:hypothetical protein EJB05_49967, partial [Eragrostis curvula]